MTARRSSAHAKDLVIVAGPTAARPMSWRQGSRPGRGRGGFRRTYSRCVALRIRKAGGDVERRERCLLAEWSADEPGPVQFWLSSLPSEMPLATLVRLAKRRWRIEYDHCEVKQALELAHFEGHTWNGTCPTCHCDIPTPIRT